VFDVTPGASYVSFPLKLNKIASGAALLLAALCLQCLTGLRDMTASFDENSHLPAGYSYWRTGDFRLNPQHPPLLKLLAALPLLPVHPRVDWNDAAWAAANEWRFGHVFLYEWGNDADQMLFRGRVVIVLLSLLLGIYVFRWSAERFGGAAGLLALALYAFCPTVLAHSRFVTMDLALAAFMTIALYYLARVLDGGGRRATILCGLFLGAALATKFSALVLPPVMGGLLWMRHRRRAVVPALSIFALAAVLVWACYFFGDPRQYFEGAARVNQDHPAGFRPYLLGRFHEGRVPYYFAVAFALKTPIPALLLIAAGALLAWRSRAVTGREDLVLLLPAALFFGATSALADDLGVRYVLPVYPLLFVLASRVATAVTGRTARAVVLALVTWQAAGTVHAAPDYLAYFNEAAGGPARGYLLLDDSNVDWGQDLKRLKAFLDEKRVGHVRLCYHLKGSPPYYGLDAEPMTPDEMVLDPAPGAYAISTHCLARVREYNGVAGRELDWLRRFKPLGRVGYSFYVFEVP
jgi:hypothetical protein